MNQTRRTVPLGSSRELLPEGTHICLIYSAEDERRAEIGAYLALGLSEREKVGYFADTTPAAEVREWLLAAGLPVPSADDLRVLDASSVYCPSGTFSPEAMLATLKRFYDGALTEGHSGARVSGEMTWALRGFPGSDRLVEYEARINSLVEATPITAVCQYDARRFDGATILDILRVHPMMIVHGQIVRNPYYTRPEEFLAKHGSGRSAHV